MAAAPAAGASFSFPVASPRHSHPPYTGILPLSAPASSSVFAPILAASRFDFATSHRQLGFRSASSASSDYQVAVDGSSNAAPVGDQKLESQVSNQKEAEPVERTAIIPETSISSFMTDVSSLVKLVDSRDIVELELKHLGFEIVIRKKEALNPSASRASQSSPLNSPNSTQSSPHPQFIAQAPYSVYTPPPAVSATCSQPSLDRALKPFSATSVPSTTSENHPMLSPMAGVCYRSPGPGEPTFVKVGDNVQKGQVVCIVEAMKLMNEIEADQSGTIVDILVEDGKPVSIDTPLFVIKP